LHCKLLYRLDFSRRVSANKRNRLTEGRFSAGSVSNVGVMGAREGERSGLLGIDHRLGDRRENFRPLSLDRIGDCDNPEKRDSMRAAIRRKMARGRLGTADDVVV
jgi:hypothetical protein